jgi:hypothetical protein
LVSVGSVIFVVVMVKVGCFS